MASNYIYILEKMTPKEYKSLIQMCNLINRHDIDNFDGMPKTAKGCYALFGGIDDGIGDDSDIYEITWLDKKTYLKDYYEFDDNWVIIDNYEKWLGKIMTAKYDHHSNICCGDHIIEFNDDYIQVGCATISHARVKRIYERCFGEHD